MRGFMPDCTQYELHVQYKNKPVRIGIESLKEKLDQPLEYTISSESVTAIGIDTQIKIQRNPATRLEFLEVDITTEHGKLGVATYNVKNPLKHTYVELITFGFAGYKPNIPEMHSVTASDQVSPSTRMSQEEKNALKFGQGLLNYVCAKPELRRAYRQSIGMQILQRTNLPTTWQNSKRTCGLLGRIRAPLL